MSSRHVYMYVCKHVSCGNSRNLEILNSEKLCIFIGKCERIHDRCTVSTVSYK